MTLLGVFIPVKNKNHLQVALRRIPRLCLDWSRVAVFDTGAQA